jgi:peptide/nickel transport system substrate-binding protein
VAALPSGEVDFIQDVPVQDLERVDGQDGLTVGTTPRNRVSFFGLDMASEDLEGDDVEGANPPSDVRVRGAMNLAIDREPIRQVVMRGQSQPAGMIAPPFGNGWTKALDAAPEPDRKRLPMLLCRERDYGEMVSTRRCWTPPRS